MMLPSSGKLRLCRSFQRLLSSSKKPFYVTTPIFYVNASPHLGHIYSMLLADTRVRWEQLDPEKKSFFLTGTDEHGLKIQAAAGKAQVDPEVFVDRVSENFKTLALTFKVLADRFIRTTDSDHVDAVQFFWNDMLSKWLIYKGSHSGWYSISDEAFYPESQVTDTFDKKSGTSKKVSTETGNEVIFQEEDNYFFRLGQFQKQLIAFLENNPTFVCPELKYRELLTALKSETLDDLSVSRPSSRLKWGIAVPGDDSQKIYVWFDALVNYLTAAGYPNFPSTVSDNIWPPDTHIVGKDITRFHCVYWPIILMAAGVELPKQVLVHSHWLSEGVKMSKSLGNVVDPLALSAYYGTDPTRFYLMENASIANDCKFSEREIESTHSLLLNKWANICSRVGGAQFDLGQAVAVRNGGGFQEIHDVIRRRTPRESAQKTLELGDRLVLSINSLYSDMNEEMQNYGQMRALQRWWETVELGNEFFQLCEPWRSQGLSETHQTFANYAVYLCAEAGRVTSICVSPFMPDLSSKFLDHWNIPEGRRVVEYCQVDADPDYGAGNERHATFKVMAKLRKRRQQGD